jgi:hypothetical protein
MIGKARKRDRYVRPTVARVRDPWGHGLVVAVVARLRFPRRRVDRHP